MLSVVAPFYRLKFELCKNVACHYTIDISVFTLTENNTRVSKLKVRQKFQDQKCWIFVENWSQNGTTFSMAPSIILYNLKNVLVHCSTTMQPPLACRWLLRYLWIARHCLLGRKLLRILIFLGSVCALTLSRFQCWLWVAWRQDYKAFSLCHCSSRQISSNVCPLQPFTA